MKFNKKKVLLVLQVGTLGGAERQALGLGRYLTKYRSCNVDILFTSSNKITKDFQDFYGDTGINQIHFLGEPYIILRREFSIKNLKRLKWSVQYLLRLRKGLKQEKYDVVIPFLNFPSKIAYYLYKILPTVKYTFWHQLGLDFLKKDIFESVAVNNMPCIIGNAENCFDIFKKDYKVKPNKFNLLPQYITLNREDSDMSKFKTTYGINEDKIVFGMIAHFRSFKYHDLALKIFYELSKNYDTAHLILQGNKENDHVSNDIYLSLKQEIFDLGISDKVTLLSNVKVVDVLNVLDVGMLLSLIEGTPNVVMEYMLYGLPVISSNHPGCIGLLGDSKFLVNNNDENEILKAVELLLNSKDLREIEGENNLKRIKNYDIDSYVIKLEEILTNYFD